MDIIVIFDAIIDIFTFILISCVILIVFLSQSRIYILIFAAFLVFDLNKIFPTLNDISQQEEKIKAESDPVHSPAGSKEYI